MTSVATLSLREAINIVMRATMRNPLSTDAEITTNPYARTASGELEVTRREVLLQGWFFNTETQKSLALDTNSEITVPSNVLRIIDRTGLALIGRKVYSRKLGSYQFSQAQKIDLVIDLPWEDLPFAAQTFIARKAAFRLAAQLEALPQAHLRQIKQDEVEAEAALTNHDETVRP